MKIKLKLFNHGKVKSYHTGSKRRFISKITHVNFEKCHLKVVYGKEKDNHNKIVNFYNDGDYTDKHEAIQALRAFLE